MHNARRPDCEIIAPISKQFYAISIIQHTADTGRCAIEVLQPVNGWVKRSGPAETTKFARWGRLGGGCLRTEGLEVVGSVTEDIVKERWGVKCEA